MVFSKLNKNRRLKQRAQWACVLCYYFEFQSGAFVGVRPELTDRGVNILWALNSRALHIRPIKQKMNSQFIQS
jgi:hypothetical protein